MDKYLYSSNDQVTLYKGSNLKVLKTFPEESINCVVTSPPYYGLRDYGTGTWSGGDPDCNHIASDINRGKNSVKQNPQNNGEGAGLYDICPMCGATKEDEQIGLESTPEKYVENMTQIFREVKRVLKKDGTLWLNLGDTYAGVMSRASSGGRAGYGTPREGIFKRISGNLKPKDLIGIPFKVAFALQADGWYLRQDIIWHKPASMPEPVKDRCTKSHEYIFLLSKSAKYYYDADAIKEPATSYDNTHKIFSKEKNIKGNMSDRGVTRTTEGLNLKSNVEKTGEYKNKRDVWSINTASYSDAHFAVFPEEIPMNCIKAGTREGDVVLDPFAGSGTTLMVAQKLNRKSVGIDIKNEYLDMCLKRTKQLNLL